MMMSYPAHDSAGSYAIGNTVYDTENEEEEYDEDQTDDPQFKRRKLTEDERLQRCRERNRVHARNTRERKRAQMDLLQLRIQELSDEKRGLENFEPAESSVASILMSLSSTPLAQSNSCFPFSEACFPFSDANPGADNASQNFAAETIERLKTQISATLSDDEELEMNPDILLKDKTTCSTNELEMIRRERNRMHAKKTRLRKKKMLTEMEAIIFTLEEDISKLRQKHSTGGDELNLLGFQDYRKPDGAAGVGAGSSGPGGSKFTGFRHANRSEIVNAAGSSCGKGPDTGSHMPSSSGLGGMAVVPCAPHGLLPGQYSSPALGPNLSAEALGSLALYQSTVEYYHTLYRDAAMHQQMGLFGGLADIGDNGNDGAGDSISTADDSGSGSGRTSVECADNEGAGSVSTTSSDNGVDE
mmetsp:Transcript_780/g.1707  ORF Transcript_780/g.1707 Transcript_780/m.1707 type:complete len:415 (+) Transcript_780:132-1376(+)|eukprot:CAMPEP_0173179054 /NCGR_PEP_ID=MMETSP1141-20130122/5897_1 /TAXON_ID=483371 /ORGANISM="non described non described, Strain CCMP2298" /LENGTH=414 /DNA_ID=CAMNT_0014101651 /DNA_START=105 /DNA_END=1349 /DNA_ORIENTATION=-